jgi:dUTP pyrophosphatase
VVHSEELEQSHEKIIEVMAKEEVVLPHYASHGAVGADVRAYLQEAMLIEPGKMAIIPTGLCFAIPEGYEMQVRPRSGLAVKHQITVLNTPGTIDSDYRGEIQIVLINHGSDTFVVEPGMRIAQLIVAPVIKAIFVRTEELSETVRGANRFGHTGIK